MDVTEYFLPPGRHLLDACGDSGFDTSVDGLAVLFSQRAEGPRAADSGGSPYGRVKKAAAYLFSIAERSLVTARRLEDVELAEQTALEALHLFFAAEDHRASAWATRLVIHAMRAKVCLGLQVCIESFVEEELRRARLFDDIFAEAAMMLALAEVTCDQMCYEKAMELGKAAEQLYQQKRAGACGHDGHNGDCHDGHDLDEWRYGEGLCQLLLAHAHLRSYQFHLAQDDASRALRIFDASHGQKIHGGGRAGLLLAAALRLQQKHALVISTCKEAIVAAQEAGDVRLQAALMFIFACSCYEKGGRFREAAQAASEAMQLFMEMGGVKGFAEQSLAVKVKALLAESSRQLAVEALQERMTQGQRRLGPRLLLRQVWIHLLQRSDVEADLLKAHAIADKTLAALRNAERGYLEHLVPEWQAREMELIATLHLKVNTRKKVEEALKWAQQAKQHLQTAAKPGPKGVVSVVSLKYLEADVIPCIASCHILLGEATKASEVLSERRQLFRQLRARSREAEALLDLADALCREQVSRVDSRARRFLRDSFQICQEALNAFSDVGHDTGMAKAHLLLADIYLYRQEPEEAEKEARQAEQLYRQAGEARLMAKATRKVGFACCEREEPQEAARMAAEAVIFCKKAGDRYALAEMLSWEAQMHSQNVGKSIEGLAEKDAQKVVFRSLSKLMTPAKEAVLLARKLQDKGLIATTLCCVGEVEASVGKWDAALNAATEAAILSQKVADRAGESRALVLSSEIHFRKKDLMLAREEAEKAFQLVKNTFSWEARRNAERALKRTGGRQAYDDD